MSAKPKSLSSQYIKQQKKLAEEGRARTFRMWNYQLFVLLYYAQRGMNLEQTNAEEREVILSLQSAYDKGFFDD